MSIPRALAALLLTACSTGSEIVLPMLSVDPTRVDFGALAAGTIAQRVVRVGNTGRAPLVLTGAFISGDAMFAFAVDAPQGIEIPPGGALELLVRFEARPGFGESRATLTIDSDGGQHALALIGASLTMSSDAGVADAAPPGLDAGVVEPPPGFVRIPAGTFTMGSPQGELGRMTDEVSHAVTITRDFWLGRTAVTQAQWRAVMASAPSFATACGPACPVEGVSWTDAVAYVNARSAAEGLPPCYPLAPGEQLASCRGYRLPTEAEREYAARAGSARALHGGELMRLGCDALDPILDDLGWYCANASGSPHPVGLKRANAWGLSDMHGNVWEWVHDWEAPYPTGPQTDPQGPASGISRVFRGGGYYSRAEYCRSAQRWRAPPDLRDGGVGFRVARTVF